jgi:hypothetical protein
MDLLERYLQAVGRYLPEATREDTLAELRANLLERMDARAEEIERPLVESDVAGILLEHGKPEVVALQYLPQRSLIGPTVFPFYIFTLRKALPLVAIVCAVAEAMNLLFTSEQGNLAGRIVVAVLKLVPALLLGAAVITLTFVVVEYIISKGGLKDTLAEWDPAALPALKRPEEQERAKSLTKKTLELVVHCLWFAYVLWLRHPFWIKWPGLFFTDSLHVAMAPVWHEFYAMLITLLTIQLVMRVLAFVPAAQTMMQPMKHATDALGLVAIGWLACSSVYFVAAGPAANGHDIANVNQAMGWAFRIAFVAALFGFGRDMWKLVRRANVVRQMAF